MNVLLKLAVGHNKLSRNVEGLNGRFLALIKHF
jgi:hypothetical protein